MKFSRSFKKNMCHAILLGFTSQLFGTFALVANQTLPQQVPVQASPEYVETQEHSLDVLIMDLVQKAASQDTECAPSAALMRCYQRVTNGYKTLLVEDVMQAMPELLAYAFLKYDETMGTRSRPNDTEWDEVKMAPTSMDVNSHKNITERDLVQLLLIIKKRIGTINDSDCANSILGILGNACAVFGPNTNLSLKIKEIIDTLGTDFASLSEAVSSCCTEILSTMGTDFEHTWSLIAGITTAAAAQHQLANAQVNQRFDVLEQLITNANAHQQPHQSSSSKNVIKTILEQTDVLSSKFEKTWDFMDEQNQLAKSETDYLVNKLHEQTEQIKNLLEEQPITLELNIEELQEKNITVVCDQKEVKDAIKKSSLKLADDISDTKKTVHEGFKDQTELVQHKFHKQAELIEDQAKTLYHKLHEQDQLIAEKLEHKVNFIDHKFHEQAELIEEQTKKILEHAPHAPIRMNFRIHHIFHLNLLKSKRSI